MKNVLVRLLRQMGFDLRKVNEKSNFNYQLVRSLDCFQVDLVLDVGANVGQFAKEIRKGGYKGQIVSFEPLSGAHRNLAKSSESDPNWMVHSPVALGSRDGLIEMNVAQNSVSSSVLPMLQRHEAAAPDSCYVGVESVPVRRLDTVTPPYFASKQHPFLKIDTQGFESQVLDGGIETLSQCVGLMCEMSFVPLYDGQELWHEMFMRLNRLGFNIWAIEQGFSDSRNGQTLQVDAVFFRC